VHRQTLVYRIRRIETLTGRSVSDTGDVAELWLGLQAAASAALLEQ
jgi:purine catabolism regulator